MKVIRHTDATYAEQLRELTAASSLFDPEIEQRTRAILDAVHLRGDDALLEFTERFDGARLSNAAAALQQHVSRPRHSRADCGHARGG